MPYVVTSSFKEEEIKLEGDQLYECYVIDLASIIGYVSFNAATKTIVSRSRDGIFPSTRLLVGDELEITGSQNNNGIVTIAGITNTTLTVSEALVDEGISSSPPEVTFTDYVYYIKAEHDIVFYKVTAGELVNTEQLYDAASIQREEIKMDLKQDTRPSVNIGVGNVDRIIEGIIQDRTYLRGCYLYFINAWRKHFPSGVGYTYVGSVPDYNSYMIEKFEIDSADSNDQFVRFVCRYKFYFAEVELPGRTLDINHCAWSEEYGGEECNPASLADLDFTTYPTCGGTLDECRKRGNTRRYGGYPAIPKSSIWVG